MHDLLSRRTFFEWCSMAGCIGTAFPSSLLSLLDSSTTPDETPVITTETIAQAEKISGLALSPEQRSQIVKELNDRLSSYKELRSVSLANSVAPALHFDLSNSFGPIPQAKGEGLERWRSPSVQTKPSKPEDLAYLSVATLCALLRSQKITSSELTDLALARLKQYDPLLKTVVTFTEVRARTGDSCRCGITSRSLAWTI